MSFLRRLFGKSKDTAGDAPRLDTSGDTAPREGDAVSFKEIMWQLDSASARTRHDSAMLLSALGHRGAIRPLLRAYMLHGDPSLLEALSAFGAQLTPIAAREVRNLALPAHQRARLMEVLGASGDPGAATLVLPIADDDDVRVHLAACAALARLEDPRGIDRLAADLLRFDQELRTGALNALLELDTPAARAAIDAHLLGYMAAGGAVPAQVQVTLPLLLDREANLVELIAAYVRRSPRELTVVTGPGMDTVAETQRVELQQRLPHHALYFATPRHSADEQLAVLAAARDHAAEGSRARVVLVGRLPSPEGPLPLSHFLTVARRGTYAARVIIVGPQRCALVMEWWRYVDDRAEVSADLEVVLTNLVLGHSELTAEEAVLYRLAGESRRDEFARALLAHM